MSQLDELQLNYPFAGSRMRAICSAIKGWKWPSSSENADETDGNRGHWSPAQHIETRATTQDLSVRTARPGHHAAQPGVGFGHQCAAEGGIGDEERPLGIGMQAQVTSHCMRRWSKAWVVSVTANADDHLETQSRQSSTSQRCARVNIRVR